MIVKGEEKNLVLRTLWHGEILSSDSERMCFPLN